MEEGRPSTTAMAAATARAAHFLWDADPKILRDDLALGLSGVESEAALQATLGAIETEIARRSTPQVAQQAFLRYSRAYGVMRYRYAEDELDKALARGVAQYVILGAGLDSFAYRRPDLATTLRIFEVDHPATQQWKRARLQALAFMTWGVATTDEKGAGERYAGSGHTRCRGRVALVPRARALA